MPLSPQEHFRVVDAVTLFSRLFVLDRVRTDYLESVEGPLPTEDLVFLSEMTDEVARLLWLAQDHAAYLNHIIELHPEELDQGYVRILWTDALSGDQKMQLNFAVERHGNLIESSMMSTAEVQSGVEAERGATNRDGGHLQWRLC